MGLDQGDISKPPSSEFKRAVRTVRDAFLKTIGIKEPDSSSYTRKFTEQERQGYLGDIARVGPEKPLGYLPLDTIQDCLVDPNTLRQEAEAKGLITKVYPLGDPEYSPEALYVYDPKSLSALLNSRRDVLEKAGWPTDSEAFVEKVARVFAQPYTDLYDVIADSFADYTNPGRKNRPSNLQ